MGYRERFFEIKYMSKDNEIDVERSSEKNKINIGLFNTISQSV